ncbi:hypothetical protein ONS95_013413 [Cadophora gregata]|uniref:uncharacterized protein n=1 Tax=Cadophora gregata TaxID=51156 RepID=UPI0026DD5FB5|nr:uncharacterized protein ONS95_013413 [Cadophora gregata]KAK0116393.1 hypothetical protein ONS95_013413 [Cadophora gregata]
MATESLERNIVIVGGGIIGCTTAYFLTRHPSFNPTKYTITILEAQSIASGASGQAGGLLALWAYPSSIVPLSYKLHAELAKEHDGAKRWGYRTLHCGSLSAKGKDYSGETNSNTNTNTAGNKDGPGAAEEWQKLPKTNNKGVSKNGVPSSLDWFDPDCIKAYSEMGTPSTTAQVHPYQFTTSMASLAVSSGAKIILGSATSIDYAGPSGVKSVTYEDKETKDIHTLPATDVVLAAGPWTSQVFPEAPIEAVRAHSVVVEADVSPYAVFSEISLPKTFGGDADAEGKKRHGSVVSPEMYARPDGTVYACGEADTLAPLPPSTALVQCSPSHITSLISYISSISPALRHGKILAEQACYLPSVTGPGTSGPLIGETGIRGLYMATGHTCWGIQNSCATGKLMSEFLFEGGAKSARVEALDPRRFL